MDYYYDYALNGIIHSPDCADECLSEIINIAFDYDGCNTVQEFKELIDEILDLAEKARKCIIDGKIVADKKTSAKNREKAMAIKKAITEYKKEMGEIIKSITPEMINKGTEKFTDVKNVELGDKNKFTKY